MAVVLVGSVVYTLGELTGGPVTSALAAEAAPDHLRGRYLSLIQLAWNVSGTIAPVVLRLAARPGRDAALAGAARPDRWPASAVSALLGRVLPLAAAPVTNRHRRGQPEPVHDGGPALAV